MQLFYLLLVYLGQNTDLSLMLLQNSGLHLLLHLRLLWRFLSHCLLSWHLKKLCFMLPPQFNDTLGEEVQSVSPQALLPCFLAHLITFSLKLAVYKNHFDIFQEIFQYFLPPKYCTVHLMVIKSASITYLVNGQQLASSILLCG